MFIAHHIAINNYYQLQTLFPSSRAGSDGRNPVFPSENSSNHNFKKTNNSALCDSFKIRKTFHKIITIYMQILHSNFDKSENGSQPMAP